MLGEFWLVENPDQVDQRLDAFRTWLLRRNDDWPIAWQARPYTNPRTLSQNALLHVWCRHYAEHLLKREATEEDVEAMKYTLQRHCYADTRWDWLMTYRHDLITGESKPDRQSTTKLDRGQMFNFMEWIQAKAADDGLILEARGEYADLKSEQAA